MKLIVRNSNLIFEKKVVKNYVEGKYILSSNTIGTDESCVLTADFVPVDVNKDLLWKFGSGTNLTRKCICFYDSDKNFITFWAMSNNPSSTATSRTLTSTDIKKEAANAKFVKASFFKHSDIGLYQDDIAIFEPEPKIVE